MKSMKSMKRFGCQYRDWRSVVAPALWAPVGTKTTMTMQQGVNAIIDLEVIIPHLEGDWYIQENPAWSPLPAVTIRNP